MNNMNLGTPANIKGAIRNAFTEMGIYMPEKNVDLIYRHVKDRMAQTLTVIGLQNSKMGPIDESMHDYGNVLLQVLWKTIDINDPILLKKEVA